MGFNWSYHFIKNIVYIVIIENNKGINMKNNADMPAVPVMDESDIHGQHYGLTKREHFAAMAMQGLCAHSGDYHEPKHLAMDAVAFADALLAELEV